MTTLVHDYKPRGAALRLLAERGEEVCLDGPAGTGKSRGCLEKLHLCMLVNPGARGLIVRKTAVSLTNTALDTYRKHVAAETIATGEVDYYGGSTQEPAQFRYANGSRIIVGGMDKPSKIMSSELDIIYVQEATELTLTDWEMLLTRLRNGVMSFQQIIADCNPDVPTHWLKQRANTGTLLLLGSRHADNPMLIDDDGNPTVKGKAYLAKLDNLTGVRRDRLRDGKWVAAEGMIYAEYDPAVHVVEPFEVPWDWPRFWSVDFGFTNPQVIQRWAEDPDGRLFLYAEHYRTKKTVDQHAAAVLRDVAPNGVWIEPKPQNIICDHDAEGRVVFSRELGLATQAAKKDVLDGIQAVQRRWRPAGDGRPRLFIMRGACRDRDQELVDLGKPASTEEEIPGYIWRDHATKEEPVKENDHGNDAMRYLIADRDLQGEATFRWLD